MAADLRASRAALTALFFGFGIVSGTWAARLPAVQHRLKLDDGELGLVLFSVSAASVAVLPLAGWLVARLGGRVITAGGTAVSAGGLALTGLAPSLALVALAGALMGVGSGVADVGGNAYGVALERRYARPILTGFHAAWSFGLLAGSGLAGVAAALGVGVRAHFAIAGGAVAAGALASRPFLRREHEDATAGMRRFAWPRGPLAVLAVICFCAMFAEWGATSWCAVFLTGPAGTSASVGAAGVVGISLAMACARVFGDRLTERWGIAVLTRRGALLALTGVLLALSTRSPVPAIAGFACVGAGVATVVPAVFRAAGSVTGIAAGAGIATVAVAGYTGSLANGPTIGFVARGVGLTAALGLLGVACALVAVLAPRTQ
ncbi:MAG TPA: MFS transporter [Gaiellaceae bacterium]|nr:MFS transporter [Gaiellaceae bacterium]